MPPESPTGPTSPTRRQLLAGLSAGAATATAGCVRELRSAVNRRSDERLGLSIATVPADVDTESVQIARRIREWLDRAGIEVELDLYPPEEYYRTVLINHDFDLFVGPHPLIKDPDVLYEALHSRFGDEAGWQNPFGFTSMAFDDLLAEQRERNGEDRLEAIAEVLEAAAEEQPFVPICVPDEYRLVRSDRVNEWDATYPDGRAGVLGLTVEGDGSDSELGVAITDARPTENLNPLSAEYVYRDSFVDLVYDSLGTYGQNPAPPIGVDTGDDPGGADDATDHSIDNSGVQPWLAESWTWTDRGGTNEATISLREATFHDGERLTAQDVAFTFRLVADTSLGSGEVPSPASRYRGLTSIVDTVSVEDDRTLTLRTGAAPAVAERAFTVPVLPEHVWIDRTEPASVAGIDVATGTTQAMIDDNLDPVGSGPYTVEEVVERQRLRLERVSDHFAWAVDALPDPPADAIVVDVQPSGSAAVEAVEAGDVDLTLSPLETPAVSTAEESSVETVDSVEIRSRSVYCLGFDARTTPGSNPYFRRAVASIVDKSFLVEDVFDGRATPVATAAPESVVPSTLEWDGGDPVVPFRGFDGELDDRQARSGFESAGYRYDADGRLLVRS